MKKQGPTADDVVAEIRAIRQQMWNESGGTIDGYVELIARESKQRKARTTAKERSLVPRPAGRSQALTKRAARRTTKRKSTRASGRKKV